MVGLQAGVKMVMIFYDEATPGNDSSDIRVTGGQATSAHCWSSIVTTLNRSGAAVTHPASHGDCNAMFYARYNRVP